MFTTADKEVPTQAAQIQNLILQGYNAIVINAASPDALNGAVKQACDAGIVVVSFDGIVTEPCAYRSPSTSGPMGEEESTSSPSACRRAATCSRSAASPAPRSTSDPSGQPGRREEAPEFKIVNSVDGDWDQTTAQKAVATVLPSLPEIVGVVDQGGDGYGAAQAFAAGRKPRPIIIMGNRQDELPGGRSRRTRTATRPGRPRRARRLHWPSGSPSRCSTAARTSRTICGALSGLHPGRFERPCRRRRWAASRTTNTPRTRPRRPSRRT